MIQNIIQQAVQHAVQQAATAAIEKAIAVKAKKEAQSDGRKWRGDFRCLVSGYYSGLTFRYIGIPFLVFMILCAIGTWVTDEPVYTLIFLAFAVLFVILIQVTTKRMLMVVYWDGGIMLLDRKDNVIAQMPSSILRQAEIKRGKIVIPWNGKKYTIKRDPQDNEQAVGEMLEFYGIEHK